MLEISLRQLETFVVTAECASFTRAADKLHLTQSTVSTHIQSLEQELDSQLILRARAESWSLPKRAGGYMPPPRRYSTGARRLKACAKAATRQRLA